MIISLFASLSGICLTREKSLRMYSSAVVRENSSAAFSSLSSASSRWLSIAREESVMSKVSAPPLKVR